MLSALLPALGSLAGGFMQANTAEKNAQRNIALQKEFAKSGIQWKVEDAKAAGVHPLYALGAQTNSFSPVSVGDQDMGLSGAGQALGRAVTATASQSSQSKLGETLQLEHMGLQNDLLRSQIAASKLATIRQGQSVPMPSAGDRMLIDGQSGSGLVDESAMRRQSSAPGSVHQEAGAVSDIGFTRTSSGGYMPVMSKDAKDRLDDDTIGMISWNMRNRILPTLGGQGTPPDVPAPAGKYWRYNPIKQEYQLYKRLIGNDLFGIYY